MNQGSPRSIHVSDIEMEKKPLALLMTFAFGSMAVALYFNTPPNLVKESLFGYAILAAFLLCSLLIIVRRKE
jgi:hypothetical protein